MKEHNQKKNWLRYRLFFIESLVFLLPAIAIIYLFCRSKIILEIPQMVMVSSILLLILAGLISLRHIFDKFHQIINVITDSGSLSSNEQKENEEHKNNLCLITKDLKFLMKNLESKTILLNEKNMEIEKANKSLQNEIRARKVIENEKENLQSQLLVAQKLEALGTLAGGIAHNFNNLLMGIQGNATLIQLGLDNEDPVTVRARNIEKLVKSGSRLTSQLLGYARKGQYEMTPLNLNYLVEDICETFANTKKEIVINKNLSRDLYRTMADANQIEQVLLNLFVNASDAMPNSGHIYISTRNCNKDDFKGKAYTPKPDMDYILLTVSDTGEGMDEDVMEKVFEPFFSTKEPGKGTGLGLASCYGIIKGHGGFIDVASKRGKGTTFCIYLPVSDKKSFTGKDKKELLTKGSGKVLVVEDEELILEVSVNMIKELGYSVIAVKCGKEAVEIFKKHKDEIDMVVLDMVMPDLSGEDVFELLKKIKPDVKILLASGYTFNNRAKALIERGCSGFIKKPYSIEELSNKLSKINRTP